MSGFGGGGGFAARCGVPIAINIHFAMGAASLDDAADAVAQDGGTDAVFGVKESLIGDFRLSEDKAEAERLGFKGPFWTLEWDFALAPSA